MHQNHFILSSVEQKSKLIKDVQILWQGTIAELLCLQFLASEQIYLAVRQRGSSSAIARLIRLNYLEHN